RRASALQGHARAVRSRLETPPMPQPVGGSRVPPVPGCTVTKRGLLPVPNRVAFELTDALRVGWLVPDAPAPARCALVAAAPDRRCFQPGPIGVGPRNRPALPRLLVAEVLPTSDALR